ncbi:MAG: FAD-binding oxidoreductase [Actinomycetota bacterium]|nr:FAD-binding oxidoreductase [Actinomycetota bacterium]
MNRSSRPAPLDATAASRAARFPTDSAMTARFLSDLAGACPGVAVSDEARIEAGRDWWPLSTVWAQYGQVPALPGAVCRPGSPGEVAAVLALCASAGVPVTAFAGASGVCGGSLPVHGGVSVDMTGLDGVIAVDPDSLLVEVRAGTFGPDLEAALRAEGLTLGHWPQSFDLSTVGGWLACRSAGQYSTRYGKIEDMVQGLEVATTRQGLIRTGGTAPRSATGPDLNQLFVGSEGTLGLITSATLRVHPAPATDMRAAYGFDSFGSGLDACRRVLRRGATPAVLRLYDRAESDRQFAVTGQALLIVVDEADPALVRAVMAVVDEEARAGGATPLDPGLADTWLERRNHLPPVADLVAGGLVVDTVEVAGRWSELADLYEDAVTALRDLDGTIAASAHQSHAYPDGACLYFTFAGRRSQPGPGAAESYYRQAFDAVTAATTAHRGAISHHHGIGLNRARYLPAALGPAFAVLQAVKDGLDPDGVLNPGKLGMADRFGTVSVP